MNCDLKKKSAARLNITNFHRFGFFLVKKGIYCQNLKKNTGHHWPPSSELDEGGSAMTPLIDDPGPSSTTPLIKFRWGGSAMTPSSMIPLFCFPKLTPNHQKTFQKRIETEHAPNKWWFFVTESLLCTRFRTPSGSKTYLHSITHLIYTQKKRLSTFSLIVAPKICFLFVWCSWQKSSIVAPKIYVFKFFNKILTNKNRPYICFLQWWFCQNRR